MITEGVTRKRIFANDKLSHRPVQTKRRRSRSGARCATKDILFAETTSTVRVSGRESRFADRNGVLPRIQSGQRIGASPSWIGASIDFKLCACGRGIDRKPTGHSGNRRRRGRRFFGVASANRCGALVGAGSGSVPQERRLALRSVQARAGGEQPFDGRLRFRSGAAAGAGTRPSSSVLCDMER